MVTATLGAHSGPGNGSDSATEVLGHIRDRVEAYGPTIARGLALLGGTYVAVLGATGLASGAPGRPARAARRLRHAISR